MRHNSSQFTKPFSRSPTNRRATEAAFIHCALGSEFGKGIRDATPSLKDILSPALDRQW